MASQPTHFAWEVDGLPVYHHLPPKLVDPKPFQSDDIEFKRGVTVDVSVPVARFVVDPRQERRDFLLNLPGWPLCSGRLRETLARVGVTNVQYFPVRLVTKSGRVLDSDYAVMNVLGSVKCLDWNESTFAAGSRDEGFASHFEKIALVHARARRVKLNRLGENPGVLLVSLAVRRALEEARVSGVRFTPLSQYRG